MKGINASLTDQEHAKLERFMKKWEITNKNDAVRRFIRDFPEEDEDEKSS